MISMRINTMLSSFFKDLKKNPELLTKNREEFFGLYKPEQDEELMKATYEMLMKAWLLGMAHNASDHDPAEFADFSIDFDLPFEKAIEYAKGRLSLTPEQFRKLSDDMKMHAFTISRLSQVDMIEKVRQLYIKELGKSGQSLDDFMKEIYEITGDDAKFGSYYEMVYRTNLQKDYNAGKAMDMVNDPPKYLEFIGIEDERQTDICKACSGVILPYTDPWWDTHWPPLHYNCRSTIREIFKEEADVKGLDIISSNQAIRRGQEQVAVDSNKFPTKKQQQEERERRIKVTKGFGVNPAKDNAFWTATPSQQNRIVNSLILEELNDMAGKTIASDFQQPKNGFEYAETHKGGVRYPSAMKNDKELKANLATAEVLADELGYYVELRQDSKLRSNRQWDAWLNGMEKIEFKNPEKATVRSMENLILDGYKQAQSIAVTLKSEEQITPLLDMIRVNMPRISSVRKLKQMIVILDSRIMLLTEEDLKDASKAEKKLDVLRSSK